MAIGFLNLPRMVIAFIVSVVALIILAWPVIHFFPNGGKVAATLTGAVLIVSFVIGDWASKRIWDRFFD